MKVKKRVLAPIIIIVAIFSFIGIHNASKFESTEDAYVENPYGAGCTKSFGAGN